LEEANMNRTGTEQYVRGRGLLDGALHAMRDDAVAPANLPHSVNEYVVRTNPSSHSDSAFAQRNGPFPVSVAVGHKSALVAEGLAATLARVLECDIRLSRISSAEWDSSRNHDDAQLVFGDSILLRRLRRQLRASGEPCSLANAKFICVMAGDERVAQAAKEAGEIDENLPLDCPEEELLALVRRLIGYDASPASHAKPNANALPHRPRGGLAPGTLRRVREYLEQHMSDNVQTEVLARIAGLSLGHFKRAFKQSTGDSPHHYIIRQRVTMAKELLVQTNRTLANIALDAGFADQSHFCRTYVAITGETPSACRRRHR
jgi:AraC-like DNA-binding protein